MSLFKEPSNLQQFVCNVCNTAFPNQKALAGHVRLSTPCKKRAREESYGGIEETINNFGTALVKKTYLHHSKLIQLAKTLISENVGNASIVSVLKQHELLSPELVEGTMKSLPILSEQLTSMMKPYLGRTKTIIDETSDADERAFLRALRDKDRRTLEELRRQFANRVATLDFLLAHSDIELVINAIDHIVMLKADILTGEIAEDVSSSYNTSPTVDSIFFTPSRWTPAPASASSSDRVEKKDNDDNL